MFEASYAAQPSCCMSAPVFSKRYQSEAEETSSSSTTVQAAGIMVEPVDSKSSRIVAALYEPKHRSYEPEPSLKWRCFLG